MNIYTNTPYTYRISWTKTGMNYYGVRYAKNCNPSELFVTYFTSSKHVDAYIKEHGNPDIVEIRKTFSTEARVRLARRWEHNVLRRLRVVKRNDYLNRTDNISIKPSLCAWNKGLTKETNDGVKKSADTQRGRTKDTHSGIASGAIKKTGRTKDTHSGIASGAIKKTGRTKDTHAGVKAMADKKTGITKDINPNLSSKKKGQSKYTNSSLAAAADKNSAFWEITTNGTTIVVKNLNEWCANIGLNIKSIRTSILRDKSYRGYKIRKV